MREEIETYEWIEKYLTGKLEGEELSRIEALIASDTEFAALVQQHKMLNNFIFERSLVDLKAEIAQIHHASKKTPNRRFSKKRLWLLTGALLVSSVIIYFLTNQTHKTDHTVKEPEMFQVTDSIDKVQDSTLIDSLEVKEQPPSSTVPLTTPIEEAIKQTIDLQRTNDTVPPVATDFEGDNETIIDTIPQKEPTLAPIPFKAGIIKDQNKVLEEAPVFEMPIEDKCKGVTILADIELEESCNNKANGSIQIIESSINGGSPPYQVSINNQKSFYPKYIFENLYASIYTIAIKDGNGCTTLLGSYVLDAKDCTYEFAFAPDKGERWKIPSQDKNGQLKIYNKAGLLVYKATLEAVNTYYWYGKNLAGDILPMGAYMFVLELEGEENLAGNVTIIR